MVDCINHLILQRRPSASSEWMSKLPLVSKQVEKKLYHYADSIDEYSDPYTLVHRIQELVKRLIDDSINMMRDIPNKYSAQDISSTIERKGDEVNEATVTKDEATTVRGVNDCYRVGDEGNNDDEEDIDDREDDEDGGVANTGEEVHLSGLNDEQDSSIHLNASANVSTQVSSQGCSRVFIVKVLHSVSEFVDGKSLPSIFTFKKELVNNWLLSAKQACSRPTYQAEEAYYGGPQFVSSDPSTHWSEPNQLYTWWKNNVERRSKYSVLQEDARYRGSDARKIQRARWCETVMTLSDIIRASSGSSNFSRGSSSLGAAPNCKAGDLDSSNGKGSALEAVSMGGDAVSSSFDHDQSYQDDAVSTMMTIPAAGNNGGDSYTTMPHHPATATAAQGVPLPQQNPEDDSFISSATAETGLDKLSTMSNADLQQQQLQQVHSACVSLPTDPSVTGQWMMPMRHNAAFGEGLSHLRHHHQKEKSSSTSMDDGEFPHHQFFQASSSSDSSGLGREASHGRNQGTQAASVTYRNYSNTFPLKLFDLVSSAEDDSIVCWHSLGTAFQVRDHDQFVNVILPKHFKHNNFTSFQRQLNLYGFRRSASYDKGAYYHPQFQRGQRELAESIRRVISPMPIASSSYVDTPYVSSHVMDGSSFLPYMASLGYSGLSSLPTSSIGPHLLSGFQTSIADKGASFPLYPKPANHNHPHHPHHHHHHPDAEPLLPKNSSNPHWMTDVFPAPTGMQRSTAETSFHQHQPYQSMIPKMDFRVSNYRSESYTSMIPNIAMGDFSFPYSYLPGMVNSIHHPQLGIPSIASRPPMQKPSVPPRGYNRNSSSHDKTKQQQQQQQYCDNESKALPSRRYKGTSSDRSFDETRTQSGGLLEGHSCDAVVGMDYMDPTKSYLGMKATKKVGRPRGVISSNPAEGMQAIKHEEGVAAAGSSSADPPPKKGRGRPKGKSNKPLTHALLEGGVYALAQAGAEADRLTSKQKKKKKSSKAAASNRAAPEQGDKGSYAAGDAEDDRDMDFIDLTHPVQRRVVLDFISPYELLDRTTTTAALDKDEQVREGEEARDPLSHFFFGVYHGSLLHQSSKDQQLLHHKLHSSTTLGDFLSKSNDHQVRSGDDYSDFFSSHQTDTYSRVIRLGDDYQADIPVMISSASCISDSHSAPAVKRSSRSASTINDGVIWHSSSFSEDAVQDFLQLCDRRRRLLPLRVGMVVVVDLETVAGDSTRAYRLCCILDIICSEVDQSEDSLVVFDGYDEWSVPFSACIRSMEGEEEAMLLLFERHEGLVSEALVGELDALYLSRAADAKTAGWSSREVHQFCSAVRKFNDNVKKVWETYFSCSKTLRDVQEFFLCIYPHTLCGGARRLVKVFQRGEQAASGGSYPDGDDDAVESDGDDPDQDSAETHSSSTAHAAADNASGAVSETDSSSSVEATPLDDVDCDAKGSGSKQLVVVQSNGRAVGVKAAAAGMGSRRGSTAQSGERKDKTGTTSEGGRHLRRGNKDSPPPSDSLGVATDRRTSRKRKA